MAAVTLSGDVLKSAAKAGGAASFPFLAPFAKPSRAGCCGKAGAAPDVKGVGALVSRLPPDRLAAFKALLGATVLTVWVVRAGALTKLEL